MTAVLERPFMPAGSADVAMELLFPTPNPYVDDPERWATERLDVESWSIPRLIRESVRDNRKTAVVACHDSAKTHTAATIVAWWVDTHPPLETLAFTSAPENHQVVELLWGDLQAMHETRGLPGSITRDARWYIGNALVGRGKKTSDLSNPAQAMQSMQGRHARYPLVVIDEAGGVPEWLFHAADSMIASPNGRILAIGNPDDPASYFRTICEDPEQGWNVIYISAFKTPLYTGEKVSERLLEVLIGEEYVENTRRLGEDSHIWQAKVLGQFPDVSDDALFPLRLIKRAHENWREGTLSGTDRGGFGADIARYGSDETCLYRNRGGVIELVDHWSKQDTEETADKIEEILTRRGHVGVPCEIDAVGVGAGVYDKLRRREQSVHAFGGGERAMNPHRYPNRRTEVLWELRQGMEDALVALDPEDLQLAAQMGRIKWVPRSGGKVEIETKQEMRKRGVKSPDRVDAVAMAYACRPALDMGDLTEVVTMLDSGPVLGSLSSDLMDRPL